MLVRASRLSSARRAGASATTGARFVHSTTTRLNQANPLPRAHPAHTTYSDAPLREVFDSPAPPPSPSPSSPIVGLFAQPSLTTPESFPALARRTTLRAKFIVARICAPHPAPSSLAHAEAAFMAMVKNLDRLSDLLCGVIDLAELVRNVHPDEDWNEGANEAYEELCAYMNELNTHVGLYESLKSLHDLLPASTFAKSPELFAANAVAVPFIRDFEKSGIHLPSADRTRFVDLSSSIIVLGRRFLQNAAEPRASIPVGQEEVEDGMGAGFSRRLFGQSTGGTKGVDPGSWEGRVLARQHPDEDLRKRMFVAGNAAPESHVETLEELLRTRGELAQLVGRDAWADTALEDKMARTPTNVMTFLDSLNQHNLPLAKADLARLKVAKAAYFDSSPSRTKIHAWDRDFFTDVATSSASPLPDISPFFSVGTCFQGLSRLFSSLYGIRFEVEHVAPGEAWTSDVRKLVVIDDEEGRIGTIYCDLFAREGKQQGAAHYTVRCSRRVDDDDAEGDFPGGVPTLDGVQVAREDLSGLELTPVTYKGREGTYQDPVIVLVCGFGGIQGANVGQGPAFLQWHEVETLFHEMGHAIHSMIGRTDYHNVAGTRCATDFVELPSILMEHFVQSPSVVSLFSSHPKTGRALPASILTDVLSQRQQFSALETSTQIMMAAVDQLYHSPLALSSSFSTTDILRSAHSQYNVIPHAEGTALQTQFGHFFGYGATYYSYLFDRAIAARIFSGQFAKDPLSREAGEKFKRDVLRWGGGKEPWEMVGDAVGSEVVAKGGREAMEEVGRWGIEECAKGS